jgi:hypothetical protein
VYASSSTGNLLQGMADERYSEGQQTQVDVLLIAFVLDIGLLRGGRCVLW